MGTGKASQGMLLLWDRGTYKPAPVHLSWLSYLDSQHLCIQELPRLYFTVGLSGTRGTGGQSSHMPAVRNGGSVS